MKIRHVIITILLHFAILNVSAQESVIFRTDRDIYIAGEQVWLRLDCLESGSGKMSELSKLAYLEVLNQNNEAVVQLKLLLNQGSEATRFILPDSLSTGNYTVRAYTKWMQNYNSELFYSKSIAVINPFSSNPFPASEHVFGSDTVLFFAEGGEVISGLSNRILIRSVDWSGDEKPASGRIISPSGSTVQTIECNAMGLSAISLNISETGTYYFENDNSEKKERQVAFEAIKNTNSIVLREGNADQLVFETNVEKQTNEKWKIDLITVAGAWLKSFPLTGKNERIRIDASKLPTGYLCALLTDNNDNVKAARYFTVPDKTPEKGIEIKVLENDASKRSEVKIDVVKPGDLEHLSVSVVKEGLINRQALIGFRTSLPEIPLDYLQRETSTQITINDLLIAFRPVYSIRSSNETPFLPELKGEIISGTIVDLETQEPVCNEVFMLSFVGKQPTLDLTRTDSAGHFRFEAVRFGEQEIVIQPFDNDSLTGHYKVNLDLSYCTHYSSKTAAPLFIDKEKMTQINEAIVNMQVALLFNSDQSFRPLQVTSPVSPPFYGVPNTSTTLDNFIELPNMEEIVREIVPQANLVKRDDKFSISIAEGDLAYSRELNAFCLVDGVPVKNQDNILKMNAQRIGRIDVENRDVFVKSYKIGKVFSLITKEGDMGAFEFDKRIFRQSFNGFQPEFIFNSPDYSKPELKSTRLPDFRNVLYWNPDLRFENNHAEISFFTSDENGIYTVVVEGINTAGITERRQIQLDLK